MSWTLSRTRHGALALWSVLVLAGLCDTLRQVHRLAQVEPELSTLVGT